MTKGITQVLLERGQAYIPKYFKANEKYVELDGTCQSIVEQREYAFRVLRAWMNSFESSAHLAYVDNPQELEKLKIFVRNNPTRKKKDSQTPSNPPVDPDPTTTNETAPTETTTPAADPDPLEKGAGGNAAQ